jgi:hypothetical protein
VVYTTDHLLLQDLEFQNLVRDTDKKNSEDEEKKLEL